MCFNQARNIDLSAGAAFEQVARPQQAIGVQIHDGNAAREVRGALGVLSRFVQRVGLAIAGGLEIARTSNGAVAGYAVSA